MSIRVLALLLSMLAAVVAAGIYAALQYYAFGDVLLVLALVAGSGVGSLISRAFGRTGRATRRSSDGAGWFWFDGGGWGGGGCGGGDGGGGGGCGG